MDDPGEFIVQAVLSALEQEGDDGWVFDGFRREYTDGKPSGWRARMVKPGTASDGFSDLLDLIEGKGVTMHEAMLDMGSQRKAMP